MKAITNTTEEQLNTYYTRLVAEKGFEDVRVALELTVRELNVLLTWERAKVSAWYESVEEGMRSRMVAVDYILKWGYTWSGELETALNGVYGEDWEALVLTPNGEYIEAARLDAVLSQAQTGAAG